MKHLVNPVTEDGGPMKTKQVMMGQRVGHWVKGPFQCFLLINTNTVMALVCFVSDELKVALNNIFQSNYDPH